MYCSKCGKEITENEQYCKHCGNKSKQRGRWKKVLRLILELLMIIIIAIQFIVIYGLYSDMYELLDNSAKMLEDLDYSSFDTQDFYLGYWYDENHYNKVLIKEFYENTITFDLELYRENPIKNITATLEGKRTIHFNITSTEPEQEPYYKNAQGTLTLYEGFIFIELSKEDTQLLSFTCNNKKEILKPLRITDTSGINGIYHHALSDNNSEGTTIEIQNSKVRLSLGDYTIYEGTYVIGNNYLIVNYNKFYGVDELVPTSPTDLTSQEFLIKNNSLVLVSSNGSSVNYNSVYVKEN